MIVYSQLFNFFRISNFHLTPNVKMYEIFVGHETMSQFLEGITALPQIPTDSTLQNLQMPRTAISLPEIRE